MKHVAIRASAAVVATLGLCGLAEGGGTSVGGPIFADTVWTAADSPYVVTSSIIVGADATLTIEPGVEVRVDPGLGIQVGSPGGFGEGTLVAIGTSVDPIVFTSGVESPTEPQPGDWNTITFTSDAVDAEIGGGGYESGSTLQFVVVEYAGGAGAGTGAVTIEQSSPFISDCTIRLNARSGLWADMSGVLPLTVQDCEFRDNEHNQQGGGMFLVGGTGHVISGNDFIDNVGTSGGGLALSNAGAVTVANNQFTGNNSSNNNGGGFWGNGTNTLQFSGNTMTGNSGGSGGGAFLNGATINVSDNEATGNTSTGNGGGFWIQSTNAVVENNTGTGNIANSTGGGAIHNSGNGARYEDNNFSGNTAGTIGGLYVFGADLEVIGNQLNDNDVTNSNGVGGGFYATNANNLDFLNNTVTGNTVNGVNANGGGVFMNSGNNGLFAGNVISMNEAGDEGGGVFLQGSGHSMQGNTITDNSASNNGAGVFLNGANSSWLGNVVTGNSTPDDGGGFFLNQPGTSMAAPADFGDCNTISGNSAARGSEVFNNVGFGADGSGDCDASFVCWGTEDPVQIEAGIWDYFDNTTKGVVITLPVAGGPILVDTTWTLAGSPYTIAQGVIVGGGATLTIEAGVEVRLADRMGLTVGGDLFGPATLAAVGTELDPITFTSDAVLPDVPAPGDWNAIIFGDLAVDAVYDGENFLSGSSLQHCVVEFGGLGSGADGAITINESSPFINACTVRENASPGLWADMGIAPPLVVRDTTFLQNQHSSQGGGMYLSNGSNHVVSGCSFVNNTGVSGGGLAVNSAANVTIADNEFVDNNSSNNNGGGLWANSTESLQLSGNLFDGNAGGSGGGAFVNGSTATIEDNEATENTSTGNGGGFWIQSANAVVEDNIATGNTANSTGGGAIHNSGNGARYEGNDFSGNSAGTIGGLYVFGANLEVIDNQFNDNVVTNSNGVGGGFYATNANNLLVMDNEITGNSAQGATADGGGMYHNSGNNAMYIGNTIAGNTATDLGGGAFIQGSGHQFNANTIDDNFCGNSGGGVYLNGANSTWMVNAITNNQATSNGGGVFNTQPGTSFAGDELAGEFNTIAFNEATLGSSVYHNVSSGNDLPAQYVCWGTVNAQEITDSTYDFFDDSSLGIIFFVPFVEDPACAEGPGSCPGDLTDDGMVDGADLGILLGAWGPCPGCPADLNDDGVVNGADLGLLLGAWGPCPL